MADISFFSEAHILCGSKTCQIKNPDDTPEIDDIIGLPPTTPDEETYEADCIAPVIPKSYAKKSASGGALEIASGWEVCLKIPDDKTISMHSNVQLPHDNSNVWRDIERMTPDHPYYYLIIS